jgi:hypothetical protein
VSDILVEINPSASLFAFQPVISKVSVGIANINLTDQIDSIETLNSEEVVGPQKEEVEPEKSPDRLDLSAIISPVSRIAELLRSVTVARQTVLLPGIDGAIEMTGFSLANTSLGKTIVADIHHMESKIRIELDFVPKKKSFEITRFQMRGRRVTLTPVMQVWLKPDQRNASQPLVLDSLDLMATALADESGIKAQIQTLSIKNPDIQVGFSGEAAFDGRTYGVTYEVEGKLNHVTLNMIKVVPVEIIGKATYERILKSVKGFQATNGTVSLKGSDTGLLSLASKIPFAVESIALEEGYPPIRDVEAILSLTENSVDVSLKKAAFDTLHLTNAKVLIWEFANPVLRAHVLFAEDINNVLNTLQDTPLKETLEDLKKSIEIQSGHFSADMNLEMDLSEEDSEPSLNGQVDLSHFKALVKASPIEIQDLSGILKFSGQKITTQDMELLWNDDRATIEATHDSGVSPPQTVATVKTNLSTQNLARFAGKEIKESYDGTTALEAKVNLTHNGETPEVAARLTSNLKGVKINLPGIFTKEADAPEPLDFQATSLNSTHSLRGQLGQLRLTVAAETGDQFKIGAMMRNAPVGDPKLGVIDLDIPAMQGTIQFDEKFESIKGRFGILHIETGEPEAPKEEQTNLAKTTDENPPLEPNPAPEKPKKKVIKEKVEEPAPRPIFDPRTLPAIDFVCEDLQIGRKKIGRFELVTIKQSDGINIQRLNVDMGYLSQYNSRGSWLYRKGDPLLEVKSEVYLRDGGQALKRLDLYHELDGLKGRIPLKLTWRQPVSDAAMNYFNLTVDFNLKNGRLQNTDNALLKITNLITLDVLDFTKQGAEVQHARGRVEVGAGKVNFHDSKIDLKSVAIRINGPINLKEDQLDIKVAMKLKISRTIGTVAVGAVNPLLAASMVATDSGFELDFLDNLIEHSYHIKGSLEEPKIQKVDYDLFEGLELPDALKVID